MTLTKIRRNAWVAAITFFITFVLVVAFLVIFIKEVNELRIQYPIEIYPEGIPHDVLVNWAETVVPKIVSLAILMAIVGIVYLVFYILSIVNSYNLEDKIPFILLLIGVFIPVVGVIGLFFLISASKQEEENRKSNSH